MTAVASLTIANSTAKAGEIGSPLLGHDTTVGGTTFHYGPPQILPDPVGNGKWVPFPDKVVPQALPFLEFFVTNSALEFTSNLNALVTPTISLPNGVVVGTGKPVLNHDGRAYAAFTTYQPIAGDEELFTVTNLAVLQNEYRENIKSGKWRKFVNGE
jgi:hypothetical protein